MDNLPSGLHRYAGNSAHTKFRIVFTDPAMVSEKWDNNNNRATKADDKYQIKKSTSMRQDGSSLNERYQASYLVTKSSSTNEWVVDDEEASRISVKVDDGSTGRIESASLKSRTEDEARCFATILRQEGFNLRVVNVPSESRIKCHVCQRKLFRDCATIIDDFNRIRGNHLFNEDKQGNGQTVGGCAAADGLVTSSTQLEGRENANNIRNNRHRDVSKNFWNLFSDIRRASPWEDTLNLTSAIMSNGYWTSIDARKLATKLEDSTETRAYATASVLMRNHYFPPFEPCQCSRIKSARADKTLDDFCAGRLVCSLCLNDKGSASDNNENRNSLDRREDNLEIPINKLLRCRCRTTNCLSPKPIVRHCRCVELRDGYKRCQKLLNRLVEGSATETMADPLGDNLMSYFKFIGHRSDSIEAKALNRKLAKLAKFNEIDNLLECNSCDVSLGSLLSDLDLPQETNKPDEFHDEADFLFKVNERLGNSEASDEEERSRSGDATADFSTKRRLKLVNDSKDNSTNRSREKSDHGCICSESHGETLLVLLEKHKPGSLKLRMNKKPAPSEWSHKEKPDLKTNDDNGTMIDKSDGVEFSGQMDKQSQDQRRVTMSKQDLIAIGAEQPIGFLDTGATVSTVPALNYGNRANANKQDPCERAEESNQRQPMEIDVQALDVAQTTPRDNKDDVNTQLRSELPLSALELHGLVDNQVVQRDAQRDYSVALVVIVIDTFSGTIQVKPDLNELVLLDLSTLNARTNEASDGTIIDSSGNGSNDLSQRQPTRNARIFYHIEVSESGDDEGASERDLRFLRDTFGLKQHIYDLPRFDKQLFEEHWSGLQISRCNESSSTLHKSLFIKLQFDIHYASGFPTDCKNLYIRYKIYSVEDEGWQIRRLPEAPFKRSVDKKLRDRSLIRGDSPTTFNHVGQDKTKLEHMTHIIPDIRPLNDSGIGDTNFVASDIAPVASDKWLILDSSQHDTNQASVMESCRRDFENDSDNYDSGGDEDDDDQCSLLLEGSTITSRPNSRGQFNFCCVEQLLLELSRKTTRSPGDNRQKFSARRIQQDDAIIRPKGTKRQEKISAEIDEQKRTKSNDRNQRQTPTEVIHSSLADRLITESLKHSPSADGEQIPSPVTASENFTTRIEMDHETDNIFPSDKITIEQSRDNNDTNTCNESSKSIDPLRDQSSSGQPSKISNTAKDSSLDDTPCDNLGGVCQIVFVFEAYSSDFYSDKLKGWSSMKVPISLGRDSCNMLSGIRQSLLSSQNEFLEQRSHGRAKCRRTHLEPRHHEISVIRPVLSAPLDRLRYYLLGEIPTKAPTTTSVSIIIRTKLPAWG